MKLQIDDQRVSRSRTMESVGAPGTVVYVNSGVHAGNYFLRIDTMGDDKYCWINLRNYMRYANLVNCDIEIVDAKLVIE